MRRAPVMAVMDEAAGQGRLALQFCRACEAMIYPPAEICRVCLSDELAWRLSDRVRGLVCSVSVVIHSHEPSMRVRLPLRIGLVQLESGPTAVCFVPVAEAGAQVEVRAELDEAGRAVMIAEALA